MRVILLICGLLLALVALAAEAGMKAGPNMAGPGHHRLKGASTPPLSVDDIAAPATGIYGFRRLRAAYVGPLMQLKRAGDSLTQDITFDANGDFNTAAAATFCTTACSISIAYNQIAGTRNLANVTLAQEPIYVPNCLGTKPCMRTTLSTQFLQSGTVGPAPTGLVSISAVFRRVAGTGACSVFQHNGGSGNFIQARNGATGLRLVATTEILTSSAETVWHAMTGVINGASSFFNVDGTVTSGTLTGTVAAGNPSVGGAATTTCEWAEMVSWDAAHSASDAAGLIAGQRAYWGF